MRVSSGLIFMAFVSLDWGCTDGVKEASLLRIPAYGSQCIVRVRVVDHETNEPCAEQIALVYVNSNLRVLRSKTPREDSGTSIHNWLDYVGDAAGGCKLPPLWGVRYEIKPGGVSIMQSPDLPAVLLYVRGICDDSISITECPVANELSIRLRRLRRNDPNSILGALEKFERKCEELRERMETNLVMRVRQALKAEYKWLEDKYPSFEPSKVAAAISRLSGGN